MELAHIAEVYAYLGQQRTALNTYRMAMALFEKGTDYYHQAQTLVSMSEIYLILNDNKNAQDCMRRAIPLLERGTTSSDRRQNNNTLAGLYIQTHNYAKARELLLKMRDEYKQAGITFLIPPITSLLAQAERGLGHMDTSLALYKEALAARQSGGHAAETAAALSSIAEIEETQGDLSDAAEHYGQAVLTLESARAALGSLANLKSTFLGSKLGVYQSYLSLLLRRGRTEQAFSVAQKIKARGLLDILDGGKVQASAGLTPQERAEEKRLRQKSDALNYQLVREGVQNEIGSKKRAEAIKIQIGETERELQVFQDSLYTRYPDLAQKRATRSATLEQIAGVLPADTALLEYVMLRTGTATDAFLFVLTRNAGKPELSVHPINSPGHDLQKRVDALQAACSDPRKDYRDAARRLYDTLLAPARARIAGFKRLIVCPDGLLWDVPFAALAAGPDAAGGSSTGAGPFLIDRYEIDYAYSGTGAAAEMAAKQNRGNSKPLRTVLAFADPDFGDEQRFGDRPGLTGERPIHAASRPIHAASRYAKWPTRPIHAASRPIHAASRPIHAASRRIHAATRRIHAASRPISAASREKPEATRPIHAASRANADASRPIHAASRANAEATRPITAASREILVPRGGKLSQLPGTLLEAQVLREDFTGAAVFTGAAAQEATVKREAGKYRYLHFATHGFFNDAAPLLSAIVLALPDEGSSEDGFLTAREIFDLDLHADMVVLSACNTAKGEKRSGEGIIGLTWALFAAGAPTQVVSQWSVNDASTAQLMKRFYSNLTKQHMQKGQALRAAALSLRGGDTDSPSKGKSRSKSGRKPSSQWQHPYYWAPFVLMGDWR